MAGSPPALRAHTNAGVQAACTHRECRSPGCAHTRPSRSPGRVHTSCRGPRSKEAEDKEKAPRMGGQGC